MSDQERVMRLASREADKQRLFSVLTSPAVLGLASLMGGLYVANHVTWDDEPVRNTDVRAIAMAGTAIGALSVMGVREKWILGGFGLASGLAGLDPVKFPAVGDLTANYGLGSDAKLFGLPVPGVTPGTSAWEWALGPFMPLYEKMKGR
jgi:hypothetical protein